MDAKSKAKFINSVDAGTEVPRPDCGASETVGSSLCDPCTETPAAPAADAAPLFAPMKERIVAPARAKKYIEHRSAFAEGLPEWSIEPPQVPIRRH